MSTDTPIRRIALAEQAEDAARRYVETGEAQPNPHLGTENAAEWQSLFHRWLLALSAPVDVEGGA